MTRIKTIFGAIPAALTGAKTRPAASAGNERHIARLQGRRLQFLIVVCLMAVSLVSGCRKSEREMAEQKAVERHEQEVQQRNALLTAIKGPDAARIFKGLRFLQTLGHNGQLPGFSGNENHHGTLTSEKHAVTPGGPYFYTQEYRITADDSPTCNYDYILVQTYSNSDFQLQKAWRADASWKVIKAYPIKPAPAMANARTVFLGPANPGAESGFAEWHNGVLGAGSVSFDDDDPATGLNCFTIGITNASSGQTNHADLRSEMFPLETTAKTHGPFTFSFAYKLPDKVKSGDDMDVHFRFFGKDEDNFLGEEVILVGSSTHDSEMTRYKTMTVNNIVAADEAVQADIWIVANIFRPWTSGYAQFDDFSVTVASPSSPGIFVGIGIFAAPATFLIWTLYVRHRRKRQTSI
jgi:hypothetical protein